MPASPLPKRDGSVVWRLCLGAGFVITGIRSVIANDKQRGGLERQPCQARCDEQVPKVENPEDFWEKANCFLRGPTLAESASANHVIFQSLSQELYNLVWNSRHSVNPNRCIRA